MRRFLLSLSIAVLSLSVLAPVADAKRLGGGGSAGMKREIAPRNTAESVPPQQQAAPAATAQQPATTAAAGAGAAAAAPKRSWMGPLAGLAAGLGLAALASHFGFGEGLANFMMIALLVMVGFFVLRLVLRRFGPQPTPARDGMQFAGATGGPNLDVPAHLGSGAAALPSAAQPYAAAHAAPTGLPVGFDAPAFERIAKMIFIRMQAANDAADLNDLRAFTTPEMFAAVKQDLLDRGNAGQQTDVVRLDAEVVDFAQEPAQQIVSVRFHGLIREEKDAAAAGFDEIWHLVKPADGSREWAIAGIAQTA